MRNRHQSLDRLRSKSPIMIAANFTTAPLVGSRSSEMVHFYLILLSESASFLRPLLEMDKMEGGRKKKVDGKHGLLTDNAKFGVIIDIQYNGLAIEFFELV